MQHPRRAAICLTLCVVALSSCTYFDDDGGFEPEFKGTLYNSNDGTCASRGEDLDFFFDGEFVARVRSGRSTDVVATLGERQIETFVAGTDQLYAQFTVNLLGAEWFVWSGCPDGTHP